MQPRALTLLMLALRFASCRSGQGEELRLNAFTEAGELAQVTFAAKGVTKCSPAVGFVLDDDLGVLIHCYPRPSLLSVQMSRTIEWMDKVGVCAIGYNADCLRLKTDWRGVVENHKFIFGEPPSVKKIASKLSLVLTSGLYPDRGASDKETPFARPLAASVLFLARECGDGEVEKGLECGGFQLLQLDNSGALYQCHQRSVTALGTITKHSEDLSAIADIVASHRQQPTAAALADTVERVATHLFQHVQRDSTGESAEIDCECECLAIDARGKGHFLVARTPELLRSALLSSLSN